MTQNQIYWQKLKEDPERYQHRLEYAREYRKRTKYHLKRDKEVCAKYVREWQDRNRAKATEYQMKWRRENPDKIKAYTKRRNELIKQQSDGTVPNDYSKQVNQLKNCICNICKKSIKGTPQTDHIIPITKGGLHSIKNIQIVCKPCNLKKYNKIIKEYGGTN